MVACQFICQVIDKYQEYILGYIHAVTDATVSAAFQSPSRPSLYNAPGLRLCQHTFEEYAKRCHSPCSFAASGDTTLLFWMVHVLNVTYPSKQLAVGSNPGEVTS